MERHAPGRATVLLQIEDLFDATGCSLANPEGNRIVMYLLRSGQWSGVVE